jgi:hypothetical protein
MKLQRTIASIGKRIHRSHHEGGRCHCDALASFHSSNTLDQCLRFPISPRCYTPGLDNRRYCVRRVGRPHGRVTGKPEVSGLFQPLGLSRRGETANFRMADVHVSRLSSENTRARGALARARWEVLRCLSRGPEYWHRAAPEMERSLHERSAGAARPSASDWRTAATGWIGIFCRAIMPLGG